MANFKYYEKNGKKYYRVTAITGMLDKSGALMGWAVNCMEKYALEKFKKAYSLDSTSVALILAEAKKNYRKVKEEAAAIGTAVHDAIKNYLSTGKEPIAPGPEVTAGFLAFLEWEAVHNVKVVAAERTVYDSMWGVAGTMDLLAWVDGDLTVVDFKTSKDVYPEMRYQVAEYRAMIPYDEELSKASLGGKATKSLILRLDKETGLPHPHDISDTYETDLTIFRNLAEAYALINPIN